MLKAGMEDLCFTSLCPPGRSDGQDNDCRFPSGNSALLGALYRSKKIPVFKMVWAGTAREGVIKGEKEIQREEQRKNERGVF